MNVGKLYQVKKLYWLLFPSKDITPWADHIAATAARCALVDAVCAVGGFCRCAVGGFCRCAVVPAVVPAAAATTTADFAARTAAYWSKEYNCNVSYVFPNSIFCLLEKDGIYYKVITANGELGWFYLSDFYKNYIEEVNQ